MNQTPPKPRRAAPRQKTPNAELSLAESLVLSPVAGLLLTIPVSIVITLADGSGDYGPRGLGTAIALFVPLCLGFTVVSLVFFRRKRLARWMGDHPAAVLAIAGGVFTTVLTAVVLAMTSEPVAEMRVALVMLSLLMGALAAAAIAVLARRLG